MSKWAMVFPGQGSQSVGMLSDMYAAHACVPQLLEQASEILGYDIGSLISDGPLEKLSQTIYTQPALFVVEYALWSCWCEIAESRPDWLAGHSLGEYTALVCAEVLSFEDGLLCVMERAQAMQAAVAVGEGAMAAIIGLSDEQVNSICNECAQSQVLTPANFNAIGQVVIAGHQPAVERAIVAAKAQGAKIAKQLPVSVPSHCPLMQPAVAVLSEKMQSITWKKPQIRVLHNVDVQTYDEESLIREALLQQLTGSVQWVKTIQRLSQEGVTQLVECGPGKVLSGLIKRIDRDLVTMTLGKQDDFATVKQAMLEVQA